MRARKSQAEGKKQTRAAKVYTLYADATPQTRIPRFAK